MRARAERGDSLRQQSLDTRARCPTSSNGSVASQQYGPSVPRFVDDGDDALLARGQQCLPGPVHQRREIVPNLICVFAEGLLVIMDL
jgi:hypothetical protein